MVYNYKRVVKVLGYMAMKGLVLRVRLGIRFRNYFKG